MLQQANYLNDKDKEVMAANRNYSNRTYLLLEKDLDLSASILKKNIWISSSQSLVDCILYLNKNMFIIKCIYYKIYADPMYHAFKKTKSFYSSDGKIFFIMLRNYTNYINKLFKKCL